MIDISEKLGKDPTTIKIAEDEIYEVDCSAEKYMEIQQELVNTEFSLATIYKMVEQMLGPEAHRSIKEKKYTVKQMERIAIALSAAVSEVSYEEMEKRFQNKQ